MLRAFFTPRQRAAWILLLSVFSSGAAFAGRIELVSQADPVGPPKPVGEASSGSVSGDGRFVAFTSSSPNLVPGQRDSNNLDDVFLYDRTTGSTLLVSRRHGSAATASDWASSGPRISDDGRWVAFCSGSDDLVAGQSRLFTSQVFLYDRVTSTTLLVSHAASSPTQGSNGDSCSYDLSADGRFVTFRSDSGDLISPTGPAGGGQIYIFDRDTGATTLVSHAAGSPAQRANGVSDFFSTSADVRWIVYRSLATDLVPGVTDGNGTYDLFLYDRVSGSTTLLSHAAGSPLVTASSGGSYYGGSAATAPGSSSRARPPISWPDRSTPAGPRMCSSARGRPGPPG